MPRLLLTTVLAITQLFSWSGAPLYLCFGCDGSVGIDFGPSHCHHCKHKAGQLQRSAAVCCHHSAAHRHSPAMQTAQRSAVVHACGCRHIQLSQPNLPVVVRAQRSANLDRSLSSFATALQSVDACAKSCATSTHGHSPGNTAFLPSPTTLNSSVVLRC